MEFKLKIADPAKQRSSCLVVAIYAGNKLSVSAAKLNTSSKGYLKSILKSEKLVGELGNTLMLPKVPNILAGRVLLVGCGKEKELSTQGYLELFTNLSKTLTKLGINEASCCLPDCMVKSHDIEWKIKQAVIASAETQYSFDVYKSKKPSQHRLKKLTFVIADKQDLAAANQGLAAGTAISKGLELSKDLANSPPNICTPVYLAEQAKQLAKNYQQIKTSILTPADMKKLGMGALLAVTQGSVNPARLITMEYSGANTKQAPVVLVGKGITFDTGGNSLKSPASMIGMKYDMCGAATVFGALKFAAELKLPINIVGVIAAAENMPGPTACRPNDIVTSMSGKTIEILNTDAEGRLVLCDALSYCARFNPEVVIDIATLTGATIMALGRGYSCLLSNQQELADSLLAAGDAINDKCWQLPLAEEYQTYLNSKVADLKNIGNNEAGTIMGGCFLARFAENYNWAHLDIASTAWDRNTQDAATGRPLPMLAQFLLDYCNKPTAKGK